MRQHIPLECAVFLFIQPLPLTIGEFETADNEKILIKNVKKKKNFFKKLVSNHSVMYTISGRVLFGRFLQIELGKEKEEGDKEK